MYQCNLTSHYMGEFIHYIQWVHVYVGSLGFIHISDHICLFICCIHTTHPSMDQYIASHVILTFIYPMYAFMRCTKSVNLYIASSLQPPMEGPAEVQLRPAHTIHQLEGFVLIIFSKNLQEHLQVHREVSSVIETTLDGCPWHCSELEYWL